MQAMPDVVYLHVGAPKTGTTYLQDRLSLNRRTLARHRVHYPLGLQGDMFVPALDLIGRRWGGRLQSAKGEWDALMKRTMRAKGKVVISHEILAGATPDQVARAMDDLRSVEVHIVYTARDIARQVPAEWQEHVKHRQRTSFRRYLRSVRANDDRNLDLWFWNVQGLPGVLERWGHGIPPERQHLVTVPQRGSDPGTLWRRFCEAIDVDARWAPLDSERRNPSIGTAETTLVRRLNKRLVGADIDPEDYVRLVRNLLVHQTLARRDDMEPIRLPARAFRWAEEIAAEWVTWVAASGIHVVGDVHDLMPVAPERLGKQRNPDKPKPGDVTDAALDALVALLVETSRRPEPSSELTTRLYRVAKRVIKS